MVDFCRLEGVGREVSKRMGLDGRGGRRRGGMGRGRGWGY